MAAVPLFQPSTASPAPDRLPPSRSARPITAQKRSPSASMPGVDSLTAISKYATWQDVVSQAAAAGRSERKTYSR